MLANKRKYQVFISSTYTDLKSERQAAVSAILTAGHIPAGMELFAAGNDTQMETIKRWIDASDIYMLILGGRYGTIHEPTSLSYIELEYDYACQNNKPVFSVVISNDTLEEKVKAEGLNAIERENKKQYDDFRKKVLSRMCRHFEDEKDIKLAILESIPQIENEFNLTGWIPVSDYSDSEFLITKLNEEIKTLQSELRNANSGVDGHISDTKPLRAGDEDKKEIADALKNVFIKTKTLSADRNTEEVLPLSHIFSRCAHYMVGGITNKVGMDDIDQLLYWNVMPRLHIYGLTENEPVPGVKYRRYFLTEKGKEVVKYIQLNINEYVNIF